MQPILIFGTGGLGREVKELIEDVNVARPEYEVVGFLDGNAGAHGTTVHDLPVLGDAAWLTGRPGMAVAVAVGSPAVRRRLAGELRAAGATFPAIVHPRAAVGRRVTIGEGTIVCVGAVITTDIEIGAFVTVNYNATVGHDTTIRDYVTVAPGANIAGGARLGEGTDLGTGATVIQGIDVGAWSVIGASAAVVRDLPANVTAVGVPARVIRDREPGWHLTR